MSEDQIEVAMGEAELQHQLIIVQTVTITNKLGLDSYPDMTIEEARLHEINQSTSDDIQQVVEALEWCDGNDIDSGKIKVSKTVTVVSGYGGVVDSGISQARQSEE